MSLSSRQTQELQTALLDYLASAGLNESFECLKRECHLPEYQHDPKSRSSGLLEKKWTSVIRLQKKVTSATRG
jgi:platelet-activating factor acetylhydrolase IB subunit alpha